MSKCQFCGQEVPEGQKCNCPESLSAVSSPATEQQTISLAKEQAPVQEQTSAVNNTPENNTAENNTAENNTPEMNNVPAADGTVIPGVKLSKNQIVGIAAVVIGLIIVISVISSVASNAFKKPIDMMFEGMVKSKAELIVKSMYDEEMLDDNKVDYDDMVDKFDDSMDDISDALEDEFGKHVKITYKVLKKKELKKKTIKNYEDMYKDSYDFKAHIEKGYEVKIEARIKGSDDDDEDKMEFTVLKIKDHGWKLAPQGQYGIMSMFG